MTSEKKVFILKYLTPSGYSSWRAAILPLTLGPVIFTSMYLYMLYCGLIEPNQRGLFEFHSTTIGDFILLPLTWILMAQYYSVTEKYQLNRNCYVVFGAFMLAALITSFLVVSSIYGNYRDWTLPKLGEINFPGIYHSAFMGFMFSVYLLFIFDHWYLISKNKNRMLDIRAFEIYWYVIDLLCLFVAVFWSDWFYKGKQTNYFLVNPPQQTGWILFLLINILLTLKYKSLPYNNILLWIGKEILVITIALIVGVYLSMHPIFG